MFKKVYSASIYKIKSQFVNRYKKYEKKIK